MLASGWLPGQAVNYRREFGLDTAELFPFFGGTQIDRWERLVEFEGGARTPPSASSPSASAGRSTLVARWTCCGTV